MSNSRKQYEKLDKWVSEHINIGRTWSEAKILFTTPDKAIDEFYKLREDGKTPFNMEFSDWDEYIEGYKKLFTPIVDIISSGHGNNFTVPCSSSSPWVRYKNYLLGLDGTKPKMSEASVNNIQKNCHAILNHISVDTRESGTNRGLVMGSVQSGKTANMIGLLTMAATYGFNVFIVLTGSIDNLRVQTRDRFASDLNASGGKKWHILDTTSNSNYMLDVNSGENVTCDSLKLNNYSNGCEEIKHHDSYVIACLKNTVRLKRLIEWLHSNKSSASKMRILLIDDEADQAGVNTAKMGQEDDEDEIKRTQINRLIINLIQGNDRYGDKSNAPFQAMNYVAFTATPYANILNEAYANSLYPKDFICNLPESEEYFGPRVIFGSKEKPEDYPGMDIIRTIDDFEMSELKVIATQGAVCLPTGLKESISWFLASAAVLRLRGRKKPLSMLIHTTALQRGHFAEYEALLSWLKSSINREEIISLCRKVYERETLRFGFDQFKESYPLYAAMENVEPVIYDYDMLKPEIKEMLDEIVNIKFDDAGELVYSNTGLHICVDNSTAKRWGDDDSHLRIIYPNDEQLDRLEKTPLFIVLGGGTLSRGLTLEGLSCTYFGRESNQADSLMQMGRWFGYRKGLELLQRIWMPDQTLAKFELMAEIDEKLKSTLNDFMEKGIRPDKFGPKIMSTSVINKFMLSSKNKLQNMITASCDYSGAGEEITKYDGTPEVLKANIELTEAFLKECGEPTKSTAVESAYYWTSIDSKTIFDNYLNLFKYCDKESFKDQLPFTQAWVEKLNSEGRFNKWNVAIAGVKNSNNAWCIAGVSVGKICRSKKDKREYIDIGSLRSGTDILCDFNTDSSDHDRLSLFKKAMKDRKRLSSVRSELGLNDTPLLLIYCIDKDGVTQTKSRLPIATEYDVVGYSLVFPGNPISSDSVVEVTVKIPE